MIRIIVAVCISFGASALLSQFLIDILRISQIGQPIREDGPQGHMIKAGTPTMGGIAIVLGSLAGYLLSAVVNIWGKNDGIFSPFTRSGLLVIGATCCAGFIGFLDDWIKVSKKRNLGLNAKMKTAGLLIVAFLFAWLSLRLTSVSTKISFAYVGDFNIDLGDFWWTIWAVILIYATSNAVNLTDGLDGLAAGSGIFSFAAYVAIGFWIFRQMDGPQAFNIYHVEHALDLAVVAASLMAACAGFLWFNAAPADIFMGDTGSLAIGTALACLALMTNTHLLLPIIGGVYVIETMSVIAQVTYFKITGGKRLFRMAPIHHHFELGGWKETKVIIRLWIIAGASTTIALALFYADFRSAIT